MHILIVEDEKPAARQLAKLLREARPDAVLLEQIESVARAAEWLRNQPTPDLIFMDIQLADGLSFDIFSLVSVRAPVIFTTAYDQYTLRAFKVNSVDYLLKPIEPEELKTALDKFDQVFRRPSPIDKALAEKLIQSLSRPAFKERFLIKAGQSISFLPVEDIRYLYADEGLVYARAHPNRKHHLDYTLDQLEESLDPTRFFRLNRKVITHIDAISRISPYFNSRLILDLQPPADFDVIVSRDRVLPFKEWLDR